jgi:hypothetical protein
MSGSAPGASTPGPAPSGDLVAAAVADALACADRGAANLVKAVAGSYTSADAAADAAACASTALAWAGRVASATWLLPQWLFAPPPWVAQPSSRVPARVADDGYAGPLTLHTVGFRAIGFGADYFIDGNRIKFEPETLDVPANPNFTVVVDWHSLPSTATKVTIVYEGEVTSVQRGATQVCDPIRFVKPAFAL